MERNLIVAFSAGTVATVLCMLFRIKAPAAYGVGCAALTLALLTFG